MSEIHLSMKRIFLILLAVGMSSSLFAQLGNRFPRLEGSTVEGKSVRLPADTQGKYTLLGMAFSKKSEKALESWFKPAYERFLQDRENAGLFADFAYDVNLYFIPMFTGLNKAVANSVKKQALKELDEDLHPHMLFYIGSLAPYREQLKLEDKTPYFFVLDPKGKIVYMTEGAYSEKAMEEVETILSAE